MVNILSFFITSDKMAHTLSITDYFSMGRDVLVALSALITAIIACYSLNKWRKELKGKSEYEIAKNVLVSLYRVREAFVMARSPNISYSKQDNNEYPYRINTVMKHLEEAFTALEEQILIAQVEWGTEYQAIINTLRERKQILYINHRIFEESMNGSSKSQITNDMKSVINYSFSNPDVFASKINAAIAEFEKILRPHIEK
jgi:hypothetical protein